MNDLTFAVIRKSRKYLDALGQISHRPLFGGYSLSVDNVIFAMASEGALYLRACEQCCRYFTRTAAPALQYYKRGMPVQLNYFRVDEALWQNREKLLELASGALRSAHRERRERRASVRLKDLPNITLNMEMMLREVGINDSATLRQFGAKRAWLKLNQLQKTVGVKVLLSLAGAICGVHEAVLPRELRADLTNWLMRYQQRR